MKFDNHIPLKAFLLTSVVLKGSAFA